MSIRLGATATCVVAIGSIGAATVGAALAQDAAPKLPDVLAAKLTTELVGVFVVVTVMESALTTLFNWRLYREFFNGRAVKTLVMIGFGYAVVKAFNYDVFHRIVGFAGGAGERSSLSEILSALVLAGGSAAIYELFKSLGLHPPVESAAARPQPAHDKAWASVKVIRDKAVGDVRVHFDIVENPTQAEQSKPALAGVVGKKTFRERLKSVFFADSMRLPAYGGRTLEANKVYRVVAAGWRRGENPGDPDAAFMKEIYVGRFAGRAIVDLRKRFDQGGCVIGLSVTNRQSN